MADGAVAADHRGIVGPLVDKHSKDWGVPRSCCDGAEGTLKCVMNSNDSLGITPQADTAPIETTSGQSATHRFGGKVTSWGAMNG